MAQAKHKVIIMESERGWGQRVDDIELYDTREQAEARISEFNAKNTETTVPDWYMYAEYGGLAKA